MAPTVLRSGSTKIKNKPTLPEPRPEVKMEQAQPKAFFPFARYTSLVGVHTSLLAFTAMFLPMSAFADLSTPTQYKSRPKREPMVVLTEAPWRTVAWMCLGCMALQWWWAGWVREWQLEAAVHFDNGGEERPKETETQKAERVLRQKEWDSQKPQVCSLLFRTNANLFIDIWDYAQ